MKTTMTFSIDSEVAKKFRLKAFMKSAKLSQLIENLMREWIDDTFPQEKPE